MRIGDLRHRMQFLMPGAPSQDGSGGDTTPMEAGKSFWAAKEPLVARDQVKQGEVFIVSTHKITCRYEVGKSATRRWQIKWKGKVFTIDQVNNVEERNRWIEFMVTEVTK